MQIKQLALLAHLQNKIAPLYLLIGQDNYLLENSSLAIREAIKNKHEVDEKILSIETTEDWQQLFAEANNYSLFANFVLINAVFAPKTLNLAAKKLIDEYLNAINPRCFIIIRAAQLPLKQLQFLTTHEKVVVVNAQPLAALDLKKWIIMQLKTKEIMFDAEIPDLIQQYTDGNMAAAAQLLEKIDLIQEPQSKITKEDLAAQLTNQCEHSPFELVDACLLGKADKAVQIIRHARLNKTEPLLILWILTQEIRLLMQLSSALQKQLDINTVSSQLKIWPQRLQLYQACLKRHHYAGLAELLQLGQTIDERVKSNLAAQSWHAIEHLAVNLCLPELIGFYV